MKRLVLAAALTFAATAVLAGETPSPAGAKAYFINVRNGDTVTSPLLIQFGLSGMGIAPAGTQAPNTGHFHLLIDQPVPAGATLNEAIPVDDQHLHFGKGQTEATVPLPKGKHTLQIVLGDWSHVPHNPPVMSEPISVLVK